MTDERDEKNEFSKFKGSESFIKVVKEHKKRIKTFTEHANRIYRKNKPFFDKARAQMEAYSQFAQQTQERIKKVAQIAREATEAIRRAHPILARVSKKLRENGWAMPLQYPNISAYVYFDSIPNHKINKKMVSFYIRRDYEYTYKTLESLAQEVPEGYRKQFDFLLKLLKDDINSYKTLVPWLYVVLDYMFSIEYQKHNEKDKNSYMRQNTVKELIKNKSRENDQQNMIDIFYADVLGLIFEEIEYKSFSESSLFNRSFVLHGRISPDEYQFIDFLRLLTLCSTSAAFFNTN